MDELILDQEQRQENPTTIRVEDPRPGAGEFNNISTDLHADTIKEVMEAARVADLDPYLMAAIAWKETLGGTQGPNYVGFKQTAAIQRARRVGGYMNPLQSNYRYEGPEQMAKDEYDALQADMKVSRRQGARDKAEGSRSPGFFGSEAYAYLYDTEQKFQEAKEKAEERQIKRRMNIRNSMEKMQKNNELYQDERTRIARYNGVGPRADRYANDIIVMRDYLRKHPEIRRIVESKRGG